MGTDGICDEVCCTQKPCLSSLLLHLSSANIVPSTPSGFSAPRSQSSAGLAAPCFCVQKVQTQIPEHIYSGEHPHPLSGTIHTNLLKYYTTTPSPAPTHHPPSSQTAFSRTCPLSRRPVSEDMAQTMERQGAGKTIKRPPCACTESEAFRLTVRRQPGIAASGSSLPPLYTTYVRVRASAGKAAWALPPSSA